MIENIRTRSPEKIAKQKLALEKEILVLEKVIKNFRKEKREIEILLERLLA